MSDRQDQSAINGCTLRIIDATPVHRRGNDPCRPLFDSNLEEFMRMVLEFFFFFFAG